MIYWSAANTSSWLTECRSARTMRAAVRDARRYLNDELHGEGVIHYYTSPDDPHELPIRVDRKNIFTDFKWSVCHGE